MENGEAPLCACGCQGKVSWHKQNKKWNTYINHHSGAGKPRSEETKARISEKKKGKCLSEEHKKKISVSVPRGEDHWLFGKGMPEEIKSKISIVKKGKKLPEEQIEKFAKYWSGKKRSKEFSDNIREYRTGRKHSEETKKKISESKKGAVITEEHRKKISVANSGENNWLFGKHHSEETKEKLRIANTGRIVPEYQKEKISKAQKGKKFTEEHKKKLSKSNKWNRLSEEELIELRKTISGKNSSNWKGGVTKLSSAIRHSNRYYHWRDSVFKRDDFICQECNKRGGNLNAHHIYQFNNILIDHNIHNLEDALQCQELWSLDNGITLCEECHKMVHKQRASNSQIIKQNEGEVNV